MENIPLIESESQEYYAKFDVLTGIRHIYRTSGKYPVEIIPLRRYFDPLKLFLFLQDLNNPDRTVDDLMLDCLWNKKGNIEIEITDELLAMLPKADTEKFWFTVTGKKKTWGETIYFSEIESIGVLYWEKERTEKEAKDDELSIENTEERNPYALPEGYSTHGGTGTKTKTAKVEKKEKPDLYLVPKPGDRKKKRAKHRKPPRDVLKYFSKDPTRLGWPAVLWDMYKNSKYMETKVLAHYTGHYNWKGRFYLKGNEFLEDSLGRSHATVERALAWLKFNKVIKLRHRGYPGEGNSIWELPFNMDHVKGWKREPPR